MAKHNGPKNLPLRRTMIKHTIGHVKRPSYDLPDARDHDHVYGFPIIRDPEDAGQVMGKWVQATPSPAVESSRSFVETNRRALAIGCITAKDTRQFANEHPDIREKAPVKKQVGYTPTNDVIYGIKTQASEDITMLIQARHTNFASDDNDYPDLSAMKIKGKLPMPRETKASVLQDKRLQLLNEQAPPHEPFKMSKFKKIGSIISTQPGYQREDEAPPMDCDNNY
ncbi:glucosidase 2 subunit beta [Achlya hypogyna]|uniref:Glucosidase 2 subunit beta n=1 Tax=Achlya hypogyna TaxID=1202772 RepID=A0A1V9YKQ4_ACHHY|nr:glucosidase 2 subunit beta [Achlya hypogyna]